MKETFEQKLAYGPMSALRTKPEAQGAAAGSKSVGPLLCATRMRVGKDLQDVARLLHIRYNYLVAIEDGRFEDLPGQAYAIGFVRAFAEHLGLDGAEIVRRFKDENSGLQNQSIQNYAVPAPASGVPSGVLLTIAVVMGMVVYGAWYSFAGADRRAADLIQEIPDRLAVLLAPDPSTVPPSPIPGGVADASTISEAATVTAVAESPGTQFATPDTEVTASTADDEPGENETTAEMAVAVQEPPSTPIAPPAAGRETQVAALPPPAAAAPPAKPTAKSSGDVIELRATSDSWIQVRADDQLLLTRLLRKGEIYRVPDRSGLTLMTGNAGGLDVMVNGTTMPPLGNEGMVVRGVPLQASRLKTMAAASEPTADSDEPDAD